MLIIETLPLLRQQIRRLRMEGKRVALVPTMGNLHDGHMKLVDEAKPAPMWSSSVFSLTQCSLTARKIWHVIHGPCKRTAKS